MDMIPSTMDDLAGKDAPAFEATRAQAYYWQRNKEQPGNPCYNIAARWRVEGPILLGLIERAWQALVDRHEVLRTVFVETDGGLVQHVLPHATFRLRHVDLRGEPEHLRDALSERLGREEAAAPFDVSAPPLLRIVLLQQADDRAHMLLTTHHLVGDCWSNLTLVREFCEICDALAEDRPPSLPEVAMHFGDYAAWRKAWLEAGGGLAAKAYWADRLRGLTDFSVPTDRAPPARPTRQGNVIGVMIPPGIVEAAAATAREKGATFFAFGLAALNALLFRWTGREDILVTTQIAGRDELELETVIGPFINTLALRGQCRPEMSFADLLEQTLTTVGEALENGSVPFEELLEAFDVARDGRRGPLNGVNFQVLNSAFLKDSKAGEVALLGFPSLSPGAKRDLDIYLVERAVGWRAQCEYDPDLFEAETVEWVVRSFVQMLEACGKDPAKPLAALELSVPDRLRPAPLVPEARDDAVRPAEIPASAPGVPAPVGDAEQAERLHGLWAEALRIDPVPRFANFFEAGGSSMNAARLLARVHDSFGQRLSLARFFRDPTLAAMAAQLGIELAAEPAAPPEPAADSEDNWRILEVRPRGSGTPIIGINSVGVLFALAPTFGEDRHMFGVRLFEPGKAHDIGGKTFEEIAAAYIEVIRAAHPKGPYILFGLCVHGVLALEIARQLRGAGEEIELIGLKNAWHPQYARHSGFLNRQLIRLNDLAWNFRRVLRGERSFLGFLGNYRLVQASGVLHFAKRIGLIAAVPSRTGSETNDDFLLTLMRARDAYRPRPYDGAVLQFVGPDVPRWPGFDRSLGWKGLLTGPLSTRRVPEADPNGPNDPGAAEMIEEFGRALGAAREGR